MDGMVLLIDDDVKLQALLKEYLESNGLQIAGAYDGMRAADLIQEHKPDLIVLDIMLPVKDGFEVLSDIRRVSKTPVIMLTARGDETDRIVGLEMGADDYLPKPFNPRELLARIRAILRRVRNSEGPASTPADSVRNDNSSGIKNSSSEWSGAGPTQKRSDSFQLNDTSNATGNRAVRDLFLGDLHLDARRRCLSVNNQLFDITESEFRLLEVFFLNPNVILSRDEIMNLTKGKDFMAFERSIDVHVSKLRSVLEKATGKRDYIRTIRGTGYMFVVEE